MPKKKTKTQKRQEENAKERDPKNQKRRAETRNRTDDSAMDSAALYDCAVRSFRLQPETPERLLPTAGLRPDSGPEHATKWTDTDR